MDDLVFPKLFTQLSSVLWFWVLAATAVVATVNTPAIQLWLKCWVSVWPFIFYLWANQKQKHQSIFFAYITREIKTQLPTQEGCDEWWQNNKNNFLSLCLTDEGKALSQSLEPECEVKSRCISDLNMKLHSCI